VVVVLRFGKGIKKPVYGVSLTSKAPLYREYPTL
jgi:hypothetical protein